MDANGEFESVGDVHTDGWSPTEICRGPTPSKN